MHLRIKAILSSALMLVFLIICSSGAMLYFGKTGMILGFRRASLLRFHAWAALFMLLLVCCHVVLNRRLFLQELKKLLRMGAGVTPATEEDVKQVASKNAAPAADMGAVPCDTEKESNKMTDRGEVTHGVDGIVLDDGPFDAWIDGIVEAALMKAQEENPEKTTRAIREFEAEHGRKIGEATPEEIAYRESAWAPSDEVDLPLIEDDRADK